MNRIQSEIVEKGPLVSVIILCFNHSDYVETAISSVINQTYAPIEIVVIDNGSTDNSIKKISSFGKQIRLIAIEKNVGQANARNIGLKETKGSLIAFLDSDDYWHPEKIAKQISFMTENYKLVYSSAVEFSEISKRYLSAKHRGNCREKFLAPNMEAVVLCGESSALFSRDLIAAVGFFATDLNQTCGWDFFRRLSDETLFDFVDEPLVYYRRHHGNLSNYIYEGLLERRMSYLRSILNYQQLSRLRKIQLLAKFEIIAIKSIFRTVIADQKSFHVGMSLRRYAYKTIFFWLRYAWPRERFRE